MTLWLNCDAGSDSYRPAFSGDQGRTRENRMKRSASPLSALVFAFALWAVMSPSIAAASTASDTVRGFYQTLLYNMQNGPSVGQQGRVARLAPVVPRVFDIPYMTQLAIGPAWATLPDPQRRQVIDESDVLPFYRNRRTTGRHQVILIEIDAHNASVGHRLSHT